MSNFWYCETDECKAQDRALSDGFDSCPYCGEPRGSRKKSSTNKRRSPPSKLEAAFLALWLQLGNGESPVREYEFHPERKWRFDFAWPTHKVAVEVDGGLVLYAKGQVIPGRHNQKEGFIADCDKLNAAQSNGWVVLKFTKHHIRNDPGSMIDLVSQVLTQKSSEGETP